MERTAHVVEGELDLARAAHNAGRPGATAKVAELEAEYADLTAPAPAKPAKKAPAKKAAKARKTTAKKAPASRKK